VKPFLIVNYFKTILSEGVISEDIMEKIIG